MKPWLGLVALACGALTGCNSVTAPVDAAGTLFEVEYANYAWVPTYYGFVIDAEGTIHRFDFDGKTWEGSGRERLSEGELEAKWRHGAEVTGEVDDGTIEAMRTRAAGVAAGNLTPPQNLCADAGTITYSAYRYDPETREFGRVILQREGDVAQVNQSADARAIVEWLISLELIPRVEGCQP